MGKGANRMQRYFVQEEQFSEGFVNITGDDAHHIQQVMRLKIGDKVICSNGIDREAIVEIVQFEPKQVRAAIVEPLDMNNEATIDVWIAQSLPKADKMETVIQRCTEIGAARFIPFTSERTIVKYNDKKEGRRLERWHKIAKEAAEQSHRNRIPLIDGPRSWKELLSLVPEVSIAFICYEQEEARTFKKLLQQHKPLQSVMLIVGPEGGFTADEVKEATEAGCYSISLGKRILRTETAAMAALTCILYEYDEIGG